MDLIERRDAAIVKRAPAVGARVITDEVSDDGGGFARLRPGRDGSHFAVELEGDPERLCSVDVTGRSIRFDVRGWGNTPLVRVRIRFTDGDLEWHEGGWIRAGDLR